MKNVILALSLLLLSTYLSAQSTITGLVTDAGEGEAIVFANLIENGTQNLAQTDLDGRFTMHVMDTASVTISYVGYLPYTFEVKPGQTYYEIEIQPDAIQLENVVVTAYGITKDKKAAAFGYAEVDGDELNKARELNVAAQLSGKVAGVDITKPSNGPGGATRVIVRGLSQFSGDNRPLIVLDGILLDNTNINSAGLFGGRDSGDGLTAINPDDIEKLTILKGLSATALYGSRGANGALIITTKGSRKSKGIGIEYTSNLVSERVFLLPNYQQEYGQGAKGLKPTSQADANQNWESWGALLDGSPTPIFNGDTLPYTAAGQDDLRSFYEVGHTWTNSLAITAGNEKLNTRTSLTHTTNRGIVQNAQYQKYGLNVNLTYKPIEKLSLNAKVNLTQENAEHRTNLTDNPSNPSKYFVVAPANLPQSIHANTRDEDGNPIYWSNNPFTLSPYWGINENPNNDEKRRFIGLGSARYEIFPWLSAQLRATTDVSNHTFFNVEVDGTQHNMAGTIFLDTFQIIENNYDFLLALDKPVNKNLGLQVNLGATRTDRFTENNSTTGTGYIESQLNTLENTSVIIELPDLESQQRVNALFANATLSINDYLYLEGSVRRDFFSVLTNPIAPDVSDNSTLYTAGSLSFILSDAIKKRKWLSFAKLRFGYGVAGSIQIPPYLQVRTYDISPNPKEIDGEVIPLASINGDGAINPLLQPSRTKAIEFGADFRLFENRIGIDATYYNQLTDNHIIDSPLAVSSGFSTIRLNSGEVRNSGVEIALTLKPIQTKNFSWLMNINYTQNVNNVISVNESTGQLNLGANRSSSANIAAREGGQIGDIWGNVYARNEAGQIIHQDNGLPMIADERQVIGNFNPDWFGGFTNTFTYKDFSFSFLIDTKQGGEILSTTSGFGFLFGRHVRSLPGRDSEDFSIVGQGVGSDGQTPNTESVAVDDYYQRISIISEENVYDASYIKLRQVSLGYNLPKTLVDKIKFIKGANLTLVARNLFFFQNGLDEIGIDPEAIYTGSRQDAGFEYAALPSTRTFGFNLNVKF